MSQSASKKQLVVDIAESKVENKSTGAPDDARKVGDVGFRLISREEIIHADRGQADGSPGWRLLVRNAHFN